MKAWSAIFNIIAVMVLILTLVIFQNMVKVYERDFDQERLDYAVEFATRAMFDKTIEIEDIDLDYTDLGNIQLNSSDALGTFTDIMCLNYDMSLSEENKLHIESTIASTALAGNNGFYVLRWVTNRTKDANGTFTEEQLNRWSPKIPYFVNANDRVYAVNFVEQRYASINNYTGNEGKFSDDLVVPSVSGYPLSLTQSEVMKNVNEQVTNTMLYEMRKRNPNMDVSAYKFYLPVETTVKGVNPIDGPSIMMVLHGVDYASTQKMSALSVSGYKAIKKVNVLAFREIATGRIYYCYETQIPTTRLGEFEMENYFGKIEDAAKAGYKPHVGFLANKIMK